MPIARFEMPDGRIARFEVPDGTTPEQAQAMIRSELPNVSAPSEPVKIGKDAFPDTLREVLRDTDWGTRNIAAAGTSLSNLLEGGKQLVQGSELYNLATKGRFAKPGDAKPSSAGAENAIIRDEAPFGGIAGDVAVTAPLFAIGGPSVPMAAGIGSTYGGVQPADTEGQRFASSTIGGIAGGAGQWGANKMASGLFSKKLSAIEQKVKDKAVQVAESETASARSAAGNAAQDAYRQLEHIRELGSYRALTPDEALIAHKLEQELAGKAVDKLLPAAARKEATSEAYKEAMKTEAERAAEYAAAKLSGNEVKQQVMARLKRYGPAALGGAVGNLIFPGLGGTVGGAATGLVLRPAIRSMVNLSKNPAVQHGLLSSANSSLKFAGPALPVTSLLAAEGLLGR